MIVAEEMKRVARGFGFSAIGVVGSGRFASLPVGSVEDAATLASPESVLGFSAPEASVDWLAIAFALRLWLAGRQYRHVAAHRDVVPFEFAAGVPLADHRKAADYTLAKIRLSLTTLLIETLLLLTLTLGGLEGNLDFDSTSGVFAFVLAPYLSFATPGAVWKIKVDTKLWPFDATDLFEGFVGIRASF